MELRTVNTFLHIAELHSFSRAARELGYSQSAVSSQIAQLEAELETPLFDRVGKTVRLTDAGQTFLSYARTILTIHSDQQSVYCIFHLRLVLQRNVQFLHHQHQVGLSDFIPSGIQQPGILSLVPEKAVQPIAGGYGIRIRIVVALDRHMVIAQ